MTTTNIRAVTSGSMLSGVDNILIDPGTFNNAELPAGAMIRNIYVKQTGTLTSGVTLKLGVASNNEYFVPASAGMSTTDLNSNGYVVYYPVGLKYPLTSASEVVVNPSANCAGSIEVFIRYELWNDLA